MPYGDFNQLLVIHASFFEISIPFIYVLMSRKTTESYKQLLNYIKNEIIDLKPTSFMTDYEVAMRKAVRAVHPYTKMFTCWFHFCQAVNRHGSQIRGFLMTARSSTETSSIYYQLMCLRHIISVFNMIQMEAKQAHGKKFDEFLKYYEKQWIKKEGPHRISVFGRHARTTCAQIVSKHIWHQHAQNMRKPLTVWDKWLIFCISLSNVHRVV